jgi:hypothetical protein
MNTTALPPGRKRRKRVERPAPEGFLTPTEVCEIMHVQPQTLAQWRWKRIGPPWTKMTGEIGRPGGRVYYPQQQLQEYLDARTVPAA